MDDSLKDLQIVTNFLKQLEPGNLPLPIFLEVARLTVTPIIEIVPLKKIKNGEIEILLTKRDESDPVWGGLYHTPGTVVRASDAEGSFDDAFRRLLVGELKGTPTGKPIFVTAILHKVKRGMESSLIFWVEVTGEPLTGEFYNFKDLPDNIVDTQKDFINLAVENYINSDKV